MKTKEEIKRKFVTGAVPTEQDFADFIDSSVLDLEKKENIPFIKSEGYTYYHKNDSGEITLEAYTGTYKTLSPIPVEMDDCIEITTRFGTSKNAEPISIVDENYMLLESYGQRGVTGTFNFEVLSSNAKWMLVTIYHNADTSITKETNINIIQKLEDIEDTIDGLDTRLSNIENNVISPLKGKKIAVIGDSISTINGFNTPSWKVMNIDVGSTIEAWCTYHDINKVIGDKTITQEMVGTKQSFTPSIEDVGKEIGSAKNYNNASTKVWSQRLCELAGCELVCNASWSGSQLVKGQGENEDGTPKDNSYVSSYSWSDYTMSRFANNRDSNGNPITPDIIFIYRGTNDATHTPHGYIGEWNMESGIPTTDLMENGNRSYEKAAVILVNKLRTMYPNVSIIFCTLNYFRRGTDLGWTRKFGNDTLADYNDAIRNIANKLGCGLVEFDKDGITPYVDPVTYYADGSESSPTHPNTAGHEVMAKKALADLKYIFEPISSL